MEYAITIAFMLISVYITGMCFECSQCDSDTDPHCMDDPPSPENCTSCQKYDIISGQCLEYIHMNFCIIERKYFNGTLVRVTRDCSPALMRDICNDVIEHGQLLLVCYVTCRSNGCNLNAAHCPVTSSLTTAVAALISGLTILMAIL